MQAHVDKNERQGDAHALAAEALAMSELLKSREKLRLG